MKPSKLKDLLLLNRFFKGRAPSADPILLNHRSIFIFPSKKGLGFLLLIFLLLLTAFVYNNNLVYLLTFFLASTFFVTILHSFRSLSGLILQAGQSKAVFVGERASIEININNVSKTHKYGLQVSLEGLVSLDISAQSKTTVRLYSSTNKRGWHDFGTITLFSTFPLGLFRAWAPMRFSTTVLVYPKPSSQERPFPISTNNSDTNGTVKKGADDFYGVREYQKGDSIKHINWKAYAKGQGVFTKQYSGEQSSELWLDYGSTYGLPLEEGLSQLCRWILDAEKFQRRYGLLLPGLEITPSLGENHQMKCLEAIALFRLEK